MSCNPTLSLEASFTCSASSEVTAATFNYYDSSFTDVIPDVILFVAVFLLHSSAFCIYPYRADPVSLCLF